MKKTTWISLTIILIIFITIFIVYKTKTNEVTYDFTTIQEGNLVQEVNITGQVKAAQTANLAFEQSGKITEINYKVGDHINQSDILAKINNRELYASLLQAQAVLEGNYSNLAQYKATVANQQSILNQYISGTRPEEISISQTNVKNAEGNLLSIQTKATNDLNSLYGNSINILSTAYNLAYNAVKTQTDPLFINDNTNAKLTFDSNSSQAKIDAENYRNIAELKLSQLNNTINNLSSTHDEIDNALINSKSYLEDIRIFLTNTNEALDTSISLDATTLLLLKIL